MTQTFSLTVSGLVSWWTGFTLGFLEIGSPFKEPTWPNTLAGFFWPKECTNNTDALIYESYIALVFLGFVKCIIRPCMYKYRI